MDAGADYAAGQPLYGTSGKLDFDPESLRADLIGKDLRPFSAAFLDGTPFRYELDKQILCLLVWSVSEDDLKDKPEGQSGGNEQLLYTQPDQTQAPAEGTAYDENGNLITSGQSGSPDKQLEALERLRKQLPDRRDIVFAGVITNKADQKDAVMKYLAKQKQPLPQLYADGASSDLYLEASTPFVLVVDKAGLFRFAGSAEGFLLPNLLGRLAGVRFTKDNQTGQVQAAPAEAYGAIDRERTRRAGTGDPNHPSDPNSPAGAGKARKKPEEPASKRMMQEMKDESGNPIDRIPAQDLTIEDLCGAKQLQYAREFFMEAARKRYITYRKGIDLCRQVIQSCPDSPNAKAARDLLRTQIPEDQREKYHLTREELGLP